MLQASPKFAGNVGKTQAKLHQSRTEVATKREWKDGLSVFEGDKMWMFLFLPFFGDPWWVGDTNELGAMLVGQPQLLVMENAYAA